ncbi:unnamed protein product [Candidula unifasciata]|uniref:V-type proton ATPase subunit n=1 Tax=Candidula unifasciata TaxID=100452 RepID=A0A8S3YZE4_9EUPU|nr:unnamed protein product [Candidula unifasciata]
MAETGLSFGILSAVWAFVGIVLPIIIHFVMAKSPNRGIVQICLILTAVCCYIFWITTFISQLNPLIGPELPSGLIRMIQLEWN